MVPYVAPFDFFVFLSILAVTNSMHKAVCPCCGEVQVEIVYTKGDLTRAITNVVCTKCALVFMWPRPTQQQFERYQGVSGKGSGHHSAGTEDIEKKIFFRDKKIKSTVADFLAPYMKSGMRVVDIGCGFGTLLSLLKDRFSIEAEGVELNERDVRVAREQFGLHIFHGSLEQFVATHMNSQYDVVLLHHAFEHFLDPRAVLSQIMRLLKPHGTLYIAVPNVMNIKKRPEEFFIYGHACTYSPSSLRTMLASEGFNMIALNEHAGYPGGMECVAMRVYETPEKYTSHERAMGSSWQQVQRAVYRAHLKFKLLRVVRAVTLWWLPYSFRHTIGRKIYLYLKHR